MLSGDDAGSAPVQGVVDLKSWVNQIKVRGDVAHRRRQIAEIVLNAVASNPELRACLVLKGGALMAIAHGSPRSTSDVDFSARQFRADAAAWFRDHLEDAMEKVRVRLGYADLRCRVLKVLEEPSGPNSPPFVEAMAPALKLRVASARGDGELRRLHEGQPIHVIDIDVSFREPVEKTDDLTLLAAGSSLSVYAAEEIVAEKLRAILQQIPEIQVRPRPPRLRRQDIYDVWWMLDRVEVVDLTPSEVLRLLLIKCKARGVSASRGDLRNSSLVERMAQQWKTLEMDTGHLPDFDVCFSRVQNFYESLPWSATDSR